MATYDERMQARIDADNERRMARIMQDVDAWLKAQGDPVSEGYDYHGSRGITGEPSAANRTYRATESSWTRGMARSRTVGTATVIPVGEAFEPIFTADGEATVRVYRDGASSIRPVSEYSRRGSRGSRSATSAPSAGESYESRVARLGATGDSNH